MKWIFVVFYILSTAWTISAIFPANTAYISARKQMDDLGKYFEDDMILTEEQKRLFIGDDSHVISSRSAIRNTHYRWPGKIVRFKFARNVNERQRKQIIEAIRYIQSRTCVRFAEARSSYGDYVYITTNAARCSSNVGRIGGQQSLFLKSNEPGKGCFHFGVIVHELIHTLGFFHAHSASNRDNYVKILWHNIKPNLRFNFKRMSFSSTTTYGLPYDYNSIMHYGMYAASRNGKATIVPLDPSVKDIGPISAMTDLDIQRINRMYRCPSYNFKKETMYFDTK